MFAKISTKWRRIIQVILVVATIGAIIQMGAQHVRMTSKIIEERDSHLFSLAHSVDNTIEHELWEMQAELFTIVRLPKYKETEEKFLQGQDSSNIEMMAYMANFNARQNEAYILLEKPDGNMVILSEGEKETFTFVPRQKNDEYEVCYDSQGRYYLSVVVEGRIQGSRYHILLNLEHFYDHIVPEKLQEDYWIVFGDEESGLMVQNHDNQEAYVVLTEEELKERNDGYTIIMKNQKLRQKGAETYEYPNYYGEMVKERIVTLPSNETKNQTFTIGVAQDSQKLYDMFGQYTFLQLSAMFVLLLCIAYEILMMNSHYVEKDKAKERYEHLQAEKTLVEKVSEARLQNSVSQMQPHFIYNALSSIRELIYEDPEMAADKLYDFTQYLRACIKSLRTMENIPFLDELEHIKVYTSIEQMRFGEGLKLRYDIAESDFSIPALSIQPLVENAIRHGIGKKQGKKGEVLIQTRRRGDVIEIVVADNGVGFDYQLIMKEIEEGRRDSTGLSNTILRLTKSVGATVVVDSIMGFGTKIGVKIPVTEETEVDD